MEIKVCEARDFLKLAPLALSWEQTCNAVEFGIKARAATFLADVQGMVMSESADVVVMGDGLRVYGLLGILYRRNPIGDGLIANEHYWYVMPEHRGKESLKMLSMATELAKARGCSHIIFTANTLASDLHDSVCRIYERMGARKFETSYIKQLGGR
ncbi:MAG: hypothetical protein M0R06_20775 [Sphaerochaeta sp.]|jgi:hypothetical protein|nr:hypothetical protein [Sphaerochaeta sp.]